MGKSRIRMKRFLSFFLVAALAMTLSAQQGPSVQEQYIAKYSTVAVAEMYRSGVPASITLAQGLLESGSGKSRLATEGNNHFGIKCHNTWKGKTMLADDDAKGECFRVYDSAAESFRDHSDFLRYRDRYKFLFEFETTDYKAWAHGLKKAGYATDPSYATKLIKYIEDYELYRYDTKTVKQVMAETPGGVGVPVEDEYPSVIPESPMKMEEATPYSAVALEQYSFPLTRKLYSKNGVPFVVSVEGESYRSLAKSYHLFFKEILRCNDLTADEMLLPGTVVYLARKKDMAAEGIDKYIAEKDGENLRDIAQRFAVRKKSLLKLNGLNPNGFIAEGDEILLRPVAPVKAELKK